MSLARAGSVAMALRTPARVLNKKCGSTCAASTDKRSSASRRWACAWASSCSRASAARPARSRRQPHRPAPPAKKKVSVALLRVLSTRLSKGISAGTSQSVQAGLPAADAADAAAAAAAASAASAPGVRTESPTIMITRLRLPSWSTWPVAWAIYCFMGSAAQV